MPSLSDTDNGYNSSAPASPLLPLPTHLNEATCYYVVLGLQKASSPSQDEIKKAYKRMALRYHPDKNSNEGDEQKKLAERLFKLVARAYEVLSNTSLKATYDRSGHRGINAMNGNEDAQSSRSSGSRGSHAATGGMHGGFGADPFANMFTGFPSNQRGGGGQTHSHADGNIPMFAFHDPFDIFRQVFGAMNMMGGMGMPPRRPGYPHTNGRSNDRGMEDLYYDDDAMSGLYRPRGDYSRSGVSNRAFQQQQQPSNQDVFGNNRAQQQQQPGQRRQPQPHGGMMMMGHPMMMDPFGFGAFGPMGVGPMGMGGMGMMGDMHQQMMMGGGGFGGGNGFSSSSVSYSSSGGRGGTVSSSTSTTTRVVNGQQVTRTVRRSTDANGHTTEDVQERTDPIGTSVNVGGRLGW